MEAITETEQKQKSNPRVERVIHVLWFNVLLSSLPFGLLYLFHQVIGMPLTIDDYTPDFLLVIISISCNMLGSTANGKPYISKAWANIFMGFILVSILLWTYFKNCIDSTLTASVARAWISRSSYRFSFSQSKLHCHFMVAGLSSHGY